MFSFVTFCRWSPWIRKSVKDFQHKTIMVIYFSSDVWRELFTPSCTFFAFSHFILTSFLFLESFFVFVLTKFPGTHEDKLLLLICVQLELGKWCSETYLSHNAKVKATRNCSDLARAILFPAFENSLLCFLCWILRYVSSNCPVKLSGLTSYVYSVCGDSAKLPVSALSIADWNTLCNWSWFNPVTG